MLAVIRRAILGIGPRSLQSLFRLDRAPLALRAPRRHARHAVDPCQLRWPDYVLRSALGGVRLYKVLPDSIVSAQSVKVFQSRLQRLLKTQSLHSADWALLFSWRQPLYAHPLRALRDWR